MVGQILNLVNNGVSHGQIMVKQIVVDLGQIISQNMCDHDKSHSKIPGGHLVWYPYPSSSLEMKATSLCTRAYGCL